MGETEREIVKKIDETVSTIRKIRQCPKEKNAVLGYIER